MTEPNAAPADRVSTERVLEILQRDPVGGALLRAAIAEASCELMQQRIDQLERQQRPGGPGE
jgi:hypothetical protein